MKFVMIIKFFLLELVISSHKLYKESFTKNTFLQEGKYQKGKYIDWQLLNKYSMISPSDSTCGSNQILGGYQILGKDSLVTNLLSLSPHSQIRVTFDFWKIDDWGTSNYIIVFIDDEIVYWGSPNLNSSGNICGSSSFDDFSVQIDFTHDHNFISAFLVIQSSLTTTNGFWGISNVKIYIEECPLGCVVCNVGERVFQCISWNLAYKELTEKNLANFNIEGWNINGFPGQSSQCSNIPLLCGDTCGGG